MRRRVIPKRRAGAVRDTLEPIILAAKFQPIDLREVTFVTTEGAKETVTWDQIYAGVKGGVMVLKGGKTSTIDGLYDIPVKPRATCTYNRHYRRFIKEIKPKAVPLPQYRYVEVMAGTTLMILENADVYRYDDYYVVAGAMDFKSKVLDRLFPERNAEATINNQERFMRTINTEPIEEVIPDCPVLVDASDPLIAPSNDPSNRLLDRGSSDPLNALSNEGSSEV